MKTRLLLLLAFALLLFGCGRFSLDTRWKSERYLLIAIDSDSQMELVLDEEGGPRFVGPTVFAIGSNDKYIVVKQHPPMAASQFDRSTTSYFIVERRDGRSYKERIEGVRGPLQKAEFDQLASKLQLPQCSKTFHGLE